MSGVTQWGDPFAMLHLEIVAGGLGAFSYKDGVPTGGLIFDLNGRMPEAEDLEQTVPILYLYRREQIDSGGAGRWARGNGPVAAHVVHGVEEIHHLIAASGFAVPTAPGLFGGYPGGPNMVTQRKDTDVREWFGRGEMPSDIDQLAGVEHKPQPKDVGVVQTEVDVHEYQLSAGAGFGDPLLREPDRVAEDARLRYVSHGAAAETFGVVLADDGSVDAVATEARRAAIRSDRLGGRAPSPLAETDGDRVAEYLVLDDAGRIACRMCGQDICGERESPKDGLVRRDLPIRAAGPNFVDPATYIDAEVQLRQFSCPSCATLVDTEVALQGDPVLRDTELR
jgi:N-methylhydantoinase B